jgi:hypothetical protein
MSGYLLDMRRHVAQIYQVDLWRIISRYPCYCSRGLNNYCGTVLDTVLVHGCVECVVIDRYTYTVLALAIEWLRGRVNLLILRSYLLYPFYSLVTTLVSLMRA